MFEQIINERKEFMKGFKDFLNDLAECYANLFNSIESQSREIKKALNSTKGDCIVDLMYAILKEIIDKY